MASSPAISKEASRATEAESGTCTRIKKVADMKNNQKSVSISKMWICASSSSRTGSSPIQRRGDEGARRWIQPRHFRNSNQVGRKGDQVEDDQRNDDHHS